MFCVVVKFGGKSSTALLAGAFFFCKRERGAAERKMVKPFFVCGTHGELMV